MSSVPSTPISRHSIQYTYQPFNSSPLVSPSPSRSSPLTSSLTNQKSLPERRRLQFKSQTPTSSIARSSTLPSSSSTSRHTLSSRTRSSGTTSALSASSRQPVARPQFVHAEDPQKQFLRDRIKAKCLERAQKARARAVKQRRYTGYSDRSSDGFDVDDDDGMNDEDEEEEDDDAIMDDELFRRIMSQTNRKTDHSYRLSYVLEVGSSFDPDIEDVAEWEQEIHGDPNSSPDPSTTDFLDEELMAYAEECERQAALDDLADIPEEELFHLSDIDDLLDEDSKVADEMDLS